MNDHLADKVTDRLYVGDITGAERLAENNSLGINAILNVSEYETYRVFAPDYLHLVFVDGEPMRPDIFARAMAFCDRVYDAGKTILIHCAYGSSRSVNLLLAFMVRRGLARDLPDAYAQELRARPESLRWPPSWVMWASIETLLKAANNG